jgi:hypothetical protein
MIGASEERMIGRTSFMRCMSVALLMLTLSVGGFAQNAVRNVPFATAKVLQQSSPQQPSSNPKSTDQQQQQQLPEGKVTISPEPVGPATVQTEHHLTKAEADDLFKSIDNILAFVSKDTGLPIKHPVKRQVATREFVVQYLEDRMKEDEDQIRLERSEATLKKFRLLPRDFNLRPFLLEMLKEQVAGFYDAKSKTMYLLDWVEPEAQKTVLAHELTHALQDQNFGMEKWMQAGEKAKGIQQEMERDERRSAREAVLEGQGMIAMIDYMMSPQGVRVTDAPQLVEAMRAGMNSATAPNSPTFSKAPLFLREILIFPYSDGMNFELQVLLKKGTAGGFEGVLRQPPTTTRNIMEPQTYLANESMPQIKVADVDGLLGKGWQRWDHGYMGEYDVELLLKEWFNNRTADDVSPGWRGGYYLSYRKNDRKAPADSRIGPEELAMTYISKWESPAKARAFAILYSNGVEKRYSKPTVAKPLGDGNRVEWSTEEGPVIVEVKGDTVFVSESFDAPTADKLRDAEISAWK